MRWGPGALHFEGVGGDTDAIGFLEVEKNRVKICTFGLPGGPVVGKSPANSGDMGWNPGPGRCHIPWGY